MLKLTKFSGEEVWVNPDTIKYIEEGGDTVVFLTSGDRLLVREDPSTINEQFLDFKRNIHRGFVQT